MSVEIYIRDNSLEVWFLLWVQEVPGSIPGCPQYDFAFRKQETQIRHPPPTTFEYFESVPHNVRMFIPPWVRLFIDNCGTALELSVLSPGESYCWWTMSCLLTTMIQVEIWPLIFTPHLLKACIAEIETMIAVTNIGFENEIKIEVGRRVIADSDSNMHWIP